MTDAPEFAVEVDQNPYLAAGASRVDAILTVTGGGDAVRPAPAADVLEIVVVDHSASMRGEKLRSATAATSAAIAELRDGVSFAVIAGNDRATRIYPTDAPFATADPRTRAEADAHVGRIEARGSTRISAWLELAGRTADAHPGSIKHAILLTDGRNMEDDRDLVRALEGVQDSFTCDCRGVGTDWREDDLRRISSALLGSIDIVARPDDLAGDFRSIMGAAMGKGVGDVVLRLWTPRDAVLGFVRQVGPTVEDLTARRTDVSARVGDYPLGSWGGESREYHLRVDVPPGELGAEVLAVRASVLRAGSDAVLGQGLVRAIWTADATMAGRISRGVAHYTGQVELAEAIQDGVAALRADDRTAATARFGRAVALAAESGNEETARLLANVVEVVDAPTGTVRLRADTTRLDVMTLNTRSTKTVRTHRRA